MLRSLSLLSPVILVISFLELFSHSLAFGVQQVDQCIWNPPGRLNPQRKKECSDIIDDTTDAGLYSPWDRLPYCVSSDNGRRYVHCLYTKSSVKGHEERGISIITNPEVAANIASTGALAVPEVSCESNPEKNAFTIGPVSNEYGPAYEIRGISGKGKGVVARRHIRQGEILMVDLPVLIYSTVFATKAGSENREILLKRAFESLPNASKELVMSLARSEYKGDPFEDIIITNICSVFIDDDVGHKGLFPEFSRLNHACQPNAFYRFSRDALAIEVIAYRDIEPEEEITITYTPLDMPHTKRRHLLHENWGFNCTCSLCSASPEAIAASESRRAKIAEVRTNMAEAQLAGHYKSAISHAHELFTLVEEDELLPLVPEFYDLLAGMYKEDGDIENARKYGYLALHGWADLNSVDDSSLENARQLLEELKRMGH